MASNGGKFANCVFCYNSNIKTLGGPYVLSSIGKVARNMFGANYDFVLLADIFFTIGLAIDENAFWMKSC